MAARTDKTATDKDKNMKKAKKGGPREVPMPHKSFKKKPKPPPMAAATQAARKELKRKELSSSLLVQADEPEFPRGGASTLSREEAAEARAEAEAEFEREESSRKGKSRKSTNKKKKKVAMKKSLDVEDDFNFLFGGGVTGKLPKFANKITLKNISPGMKLWGVIVEVNPKDLVIGLPGGLRGYVRTEDATDILLNNENKGSESNFLTSIFHVDQLVPCVVLQVADEKKNGKGNIRIWLSLRLSLLYKGLTLEAVQEGMLLSAQVKSIEDHGYILFFGSLSFSGFMTRNEKERSQTTPGRFLQCVVKQIDKARSVVYVNSDPDLVAKYITNDVKGLSVDLLIPGMMVSARVRSVLENGIMLSFLTYFSGTVDMFHLQNLFPDGNWKDDYNENKRVNARILFINPSTRAVGLTLNTYLVNNRAPLAHAKVGEIYDESKIVRVDKGAGLLLEIPSIPEPSAAYVNVFDASDEEVLNFEKRFKEGNYVRTRIIGCKHLEGLAIATLKESAFEGSVFTHSDVKPGMLVKAKVLGVENFGAIVQFRSGVKALCPLPHMSELDIVKPPKKFKVGAELLFRVLGCKSKRITVTHKKTLVKSKLNVLSSYSDATEGIITHGWISKIEKHGCFLKFYNGVHGFAHRSELGLDLATEPDSGYHVGQVVKCRVINSTPAARRISVSFVMSSKRTSDGDMPKLGSIISGVVDRLTPTAVVVSMNNYGYLKGTIFDEHLADHHGQASMLKSLLKPGYIFDQLMVIECDGKNLNLSAKYSLINSAGQMPSAIEDINPQSVIYGYICNIIETGCFVRFLSRLTGFSPMNMATDEHVKNLSDVFYHGQSVRSHIMSVNSESGRIKLSLKQSLCSSLDASFLRGYFLLEEKISALQLADSKTSDSNWTTSFSIGSLVKGEVQEMKEFGVVLGFKDHADVVGFIAQHQLGGMTVEKGSTVKALVLDVAKSDCLVDLSLKPELINSASAGKRKKRHRSTINDLKPQEAVNAVVEIVKENYLVLSLPEHNYAIGFASVTDYNIQKLPLEQYSTGQSVIATVGGFTSSESSGRPLLLLRSSMESPEICSKRAKKRSCFTVGSLVSVEILDIKPLELIVKFGYGCRGRVHITEIVEDDDDHEPSENPLTKFNNGQILNARIVAKVGQSTKKTKSYDWELSLRPSLVAGFDGTNTDVGEVCDYSVGSTVKGYITRVDGDWVWLTVSRSTMAHLYILDSSCEPSMLQNFQQCYNIGQMVKGQIISINAEKKLLRLATVVYSELPSLNEIASNINSEIASNIPQHIFQGAVVGGRIKKVLPGIGGILVQIGPHLFGRAHYTELVDEWVPNPLSSYVEGQYVKCRILNINRSPEGNLHVDLSLRSSLHEVEPAISDVLRTKLVSSSNRIERVDDLKPDMDVKGYVKSITSKGCFIMISREIDARILLSNLSDGYIDNLEKDFPVGKLVNGRVLTVDPSKKVEVSLKKGTGSDAVKAVVGDIQDLNVGDVISGKVRRVESFGLFITIDKIDKVGLCHISELSDEPIDDIEAKYRAGDKVQAKVLKIDSERQRISLGLKKSYLGNETSSLSMSDEAMDIQDLTDFALPNGKLFNDEKFLGYENGDSMFPHPEKIVPPCLPVVLDETEPSGVDVSEIPNQDSVNPKDEAMKVIDRRQKKRAKELKELEVSALEERRMQKDMPRTVDEFEKLVRSSPNSSFVWIKYMAYMLSLGDVKKARSIAERALEMINIREEGEKLNIWVAYFNLENEYGKPPEEAVQSTFQRALQYCDAKKIHLALLGMYERTEQHNFAEDLLEKMTRKFKHSCKVWLHCIQNSLTKDKDGVTSVVKRALLSLPQKKHIKFRSKVAMLMFKCGVPDEGRSTFESILREYPKRTDLWSVYLDQVIRLGDTEVTRSLFERAISLSLPPKKMKFLFTKYLDFEKTHGDEASVEHVKERAFEYAETSLA